MSDRLEKDSQAGRITGSILNHGRSAAIASSSVLLLTIAHHSYGAVRFATPWRHHVSLIALPIALVLWVTYFIFSQPDSRAGRVARGVFICVALLGPVGWIGIFEGGYNHVLKIILFQSNISPLTFRRFYPPDTYEAPHDWLFEATGVMQLAVALWALMTIRRFQRLSHRSRTG
jgi:hypothetical protein